jgi:hypothetical protein
LNALVFHRRLNAGELGHRLGVNVSVTLFFGLSRQRRTLLTFAV